MTLQVSVIGTGYLGATHAVAMAELGYDVLGVEVNPIAVGVPSDEVNCPSSNPVSRR